MKDFINPQTRAREKYLHEVRMNLTETDELYKKWNENKPKVELTKEQIDVLHAKDEENRKRNHNELGESKYWTNEYLEQKYADKTLKDLWEV